MALVRPDRRLDYAVANVPGHGSLGYGDMSDDLKAAALLGDVVAFKGKNSWGTAVPDYGVTDGQTYFEADYLFEPLEWKSDAAGSWTMHYTTLIGFVLPPR